jgi:hypothetical protein
MSEAKLEERIAKRIRRKRTDVFLRKDFEDEGGYDQIGRALRSLVNKGELIPMGRGLYGRAVRSPFNGKPVLAKGIKTMTEEALRRLGVKTYPSEMTRAYNEGKTTQVPSGRVIGVDKRVRRKIGVDGVYVRFERARADQG